ncbi:MAG: substrate-binding domain-containing protein, partial [Candidatus Sedimenticola endophacoides]
MGDICPGAWCRSRRVRIGLLVLLAMLADPGRAEGLVGAAGEEQTRPRLAYLVSDLRIPFWDILWRGIRSRAEGLGYRVQVYSANNGAKRELEHAVKVIRGGVDGIIVSPTNSSACATILKFARQGGIPVVIADVGTDGGAFVSYISSDNRDGAYRTSVSLPRERFWDIPVPKIDSPTRQPLLPR